VEEGYPLPLEMDPATVSLVDRRWGNTVCSSVGADDGSRTAGTRCSRVRRLSGLGYAVAEGCWEKEPASPEQARWVKLGRAVSQLSSLGEVRAFPPT
jgi:hypothetical protein